jgi:putative component of membrane protein insertase Oxa1/YidC/SpoIIIJ protein YidD
VAGKKIADQPLFDKACSEYAQATVDMLNSLDGSTLAAK